MAVTEAQYWIDSLGLQPHPEGGWFAESYRSSRSLDAAALPVGYGSARSLITSIYYLLTPGDISRFHRLRSDELWYFHAGKSLTVHVMERGGTYHTIALGLRHDSGEVPQGVVPAGSWFGASFDHEDGFALVGCAVAPGFSFADFEMGEKDRLLVAFPGCRTIIERLGLP